MEFKQASLTSDIIMVFSDEITKEKEILLIIRKSEPDQGLPALPGGYVEIEKEETFLEAANRELFEEVNLTGDLTFFKICDAPKRDPRARTISAVYYYITSNPEIKKNVKAKDDADSYFWVKVNEIPEVMAFDHKDILAEFKKTILGV